MIGDVALIGDARLLRFQPRILRGALQEVIFMFRRDPDSGMGAALLRLRLEHHLSIG
jgi:hypothetical protein